MIPQPSSQLIRKSFVAPVLAQPVDGQALEEQREPRSRRGPRHQDLHHALLATFHQGDPRVQVGLELAAVQMPPRPLLGVIVPRQRLGAVRARPPRVLRVLGPHDHARPCDVQMDAAHRPRRLQAPQVWIPLGVVHGGLLMRPPSCPVRLPMRNPDAPLKEAGQYEPASFSRSSLQPATHLLAVPLQIDRVHNRFCQIQFPPCAPGNFF